MTTLRSWILLVACGIGSILLHLSPLEARQVVTDPAPWVRGVVTDQESGIPLATGYVSLHRPDGEQVAQAFTDDQGRYTLQAPGPGTYQARAERLGYHAQEKGPFTLRASDTLSLDFQLSPSPLLLDSILVSVRREGRPLRAGEQLVYGRLLDDESREGISNGLVRLLQESGRSAATVLSDEQGLFWLVSPSPGSYRIQAERLGYHTATGPPLSLMPGDTMGVDFYLSMEAILLNPLVVTATAWPLSDRYDMTGMAGFWQRYKPPDGGRPPRRANPGQASVWLPYATDEAQRSPCRPPRSEG